MKNVLVTRPQDQAGEIVQLLENEGFGTFVEPLFTVKKLAIEQKFSTAISALIVTSANACDAVKNSGVPKNIKIFAVGKKTAQKLQENGFDNIILPPENSALSLKNLIVETHKDKTGLILYFHGSVISLDFAAELKKSGFNIENILVYETNEVANFSDEFLEFSKKNPCEEVLIFSQNSAEIFFKLVKKHNMLEYFSDSRILCLSEKILICMKNFGFKKLSIFSEIPILKNFYD